MKRTLLLLWLVPLACATSGPAAAPPGLGMLSPRAEDDHLRSGQALFSARCQRCHALPDPSVKAPEAWPAEVAGMSAKSGLTPDQGALITDYLVAASRALGAKEMATHVVQR